MNVIDRLRIDWATGVYDFWLEYRGVPWRRRRELRRELRANLLDAAAHEGATRALLGVGSTRVMAYEVAESYRRTPRWALGGYAALATLLVGLLGWVLGTLGFVAGVRSSGTVGRPVSGNAPPWGGEVVVELDADGFVSAVSAMVPAAMLVAVLVVFLVASQPWRALGRHRVEGAASHA